MVLDVLPEKECIRLRTEVHGSLAYTVYDMGKSGVVRGRAGSDSNSIDRHPASSQRSRKGTRAESLTNGSVTA